MIPKTVIVGCFEYEVIETNEVIIVNGRECKGSIDYQLQQIKIKKDEMSDQQKEQTFWHEVVHAIIDYRSVNPQIADPEVLVEELALGLYGMMKHNGALPGQSRPQ